VAPGEKNATSRINTHRSIMYSAKLVTFAITLSATAGITPQIRAQERSALASQLGVFVYPKNNQDSGQQAKDENECYQSAKQQSGIDPAAPPPPPQQAQQAKGGAVKGAAKAAAGGAAIGAIAGDAGDGAAIGATAGAVHGRRKQKKANKQAEQQAAQQAQAQQQKTIETFKKGFSACMDARQYSVK
jgi:hypothetical protein